MQHCAQALQTTLDHVRGYHKLLSALGLDKKVYSHENASFMFFSDGDHEGSLCDTALDDRPVAMRLSCG